MAHEVDDQAKKVTISSIYIIRLRSKIHRQVKTKSANIFKDYGSKELIKWNTYRACMRRNGVWQSVDLNERLTKDIFEGVMSRYVFEQTSENGAHSRNRWNKTVNLTVPSRMSQLVEVSSLWSSLLSVNGDRYMQDLVRDFDITLGGICKSPII